MVDKSTFSASTAVPAFPGATNTRPARGLCLSFQANACSRPPLPIIRMFVIAGFGPPCLPRSEFAAIQYNYCCRSPELQQALRANLFSSLDIQMPTRNDLALMSDFKADVRNGVVPAALRPSRLRACHTDVLRGSRRQGIGRRRERRGGDDCNWSSCNRGGEFDAECRAAADGAIDTNAAMMGFDDIAAGR